MHCIRQVATLLGYQEPQILEVFKNIDVSHDTILIIGVVTDTICKVIRDMGDRIIVTEGE